ncbi:MAG: phage major capsid protein [Rhodobacteraceae bacterium]|nr:phage major capsid protein [Paracoccaceae bacterium]
MMKTETKARAGAGMSAGGPEDDEALAAAVLRDLGALEEQVSRRLTAQEDRIAALDRKAAAASARPALSRAVQQEAPHRKAFAAYLRHGDDDGLRGLVPEGKAMSTAVAADGGYLVDPQMAETIRSSLRANASIRSIASVVTVESGSFDVLVDRSELGSGWATETGDTVETDTPQFEKITIPLHELSAMPKASQRLLDDAAFDVESWLAQRIAERFARAEAAAFISGDGNDKPMGFMTHTSVPEEEWSWGKIGFVTTGVSGDFAAANPADAIVDLVYALGARYRANASFVMNSKTAGAVRKMKDADGRFLWTDGLAAAEPARLMGYPVLLCEDMPDIGTGAIAMAFGDFAAGYTVAERPDLRILRDPFSAKPHVLFYASKRVGGDVSDFAAIKLLKFSVS